MRIVHGPVLKAAVSLIMAVGLVVGFSAGTALAADAGQDGCRPVSKPVAFRQTGTNTIESIFNIVGQPPCSEGVSLTLAIWESCDLGARPISSQTLYGYATQTYNAGSGQTISTTVPTDHYWQADLIYGDSPGSSPHYVDNIIGTAFGGDSCVTSPPPAGSTTTTTTTNNNTNNNANSNSNVNNVTIAPATTSATSASTSSSSAPPSSATSSAQTTSASTQQPTSLVNTGPGDVVGLFAATSTAGALLHRFILRRFIH